MGSIRSWQFWVIVVLAFSTLACAGRAEKRERREMAREERRERAEQRRIERQEAQDRRSTAASFTPVAAPTSGAAADGSARIVCMRGSKQSAGVDAALFDVTEPGAPKYIGTVNSASKLTHPLSPGLYTFMAVGDTAEFMQATIVGGKTYY